MDYLYTTLHQARLDGSGRDTPTYHSDLQFLFDPSILIYMPNDTFCDFQHYSYPLSGSNDVGFTEIPV
ncbi:hypothetical protein BT96DRAFT_919066 [Gymnopus androsaceus JB14]|uniref:Uncharacterized protein n=1 Tax=Gymnopus androsaceus JB14 TaxID=1447944 RepID=A0A6A4HUZ5_9AGAR|nr:hypothetical protein BT96DRAFT_919066 [Gymnopus androsaceus JB14]